MMVDLLVKNPNLHTKKKWKYRLKPLGQLLVFSLFSFLAEAVFIIFIVISCCWIKAE
jgi:hypothetical protein